MDRKRSKGIVLLAALALALACALPPAAFADDLAAGTLGGEAPASAEGGVAETAPPAKLVYSVRGPGKWKAGKSDGATAAAGKKSASVSALRVSSQGASGSVQYQAYLKKSGWQAVKSNGKVAGAAKGKQVVQGIRIALTGELSAWYDVVYRVKGSGGWQAWKRNGAVAGKAGKGRISAVQAKLVPKAAKAAPADGIVGVRYRAKLDGSGWQVWKANNATGGKTGKKAHLKNLRIAIDKGSYSGDVKYRVRTTKHKWKGWKKNGKAVGSRNIEALQVKLTGSLASRYDVVYRVYVDKVGWQARMRNGATVGTSKARKIRAVKVQIVPVSARSGWVGSGSDWRYYQGGKPVAGRWVTTKESPIDMLTAKKKRYWIDANGKLAVNRLIDPSSAEDAGAGSLAIASKNGYLLTDDIFYSDKTGNWYRADKSGRVSKLDSANLVVEKYLKWAIGVAGDAKHGYSQINRWGNPDYDCSSFVISALRAAGVKTGGATYTGNMKSELTKHGFTWHTDLKNIRRGDILLVHRVGGRQHTEIYLGNNKTVGAHSDENGGIVGRKGGDQTGNEISVGPYFNIWQGYLRFSF